MRVTEVLDKDFEKLVLLNDKPVLLDFSATWCAPCRMFAPTLEKLASDLSGDVSVQRLDVDDSPNTASRFGIRGIPTLILFQEGREESRIVGATSHHRVYTMVQELAYKKEFERTPENEFAALTVVDGKVRLVSLLPDGTYKFLDKTDKYHNLLYTYSLDSRALKYAVEEFEEMINDRKSSEQDFHNFFDKYPDFILNDEYKKAHSKIVLERLDIGSGSLVPDFLLEPLSRSALCDLLELKTPLANTYVLKKNRVRFSADVLEAVAQLREYSLYFDEKSHRDKLEERYGLSAYKPRMYIILGRTGKVNPFEARNVELDIPGVTLRTYDDVLERMRRKVRK